MSRLGFTHLFNGDCNFFFAGERFEPGDGSPFNMSRICEYLDMLAECGVEVFIANSVGAMPWYPSRRVIHTLTGYVRGDRDFPRGHFPPCDPTFTPEMLERRIDDVLAMLDRMLDLQDAGIDWLAEVAAHCRRRGMTPWTSVRMNDMHGANSWSSSFMNNPPQRNPACRLEGRWINPNRPANRMLQTADYAHRDVRDYMFETIRELINDYDFAGLELDWLRCPFCCNPSASEDQVKLITRWHADIADLARARSAATGKPFPIGVRIPVRLGLLRDVGLDIVTMAREGIIDFVGFSNFWQNSWDVPYEALREQLGDRVAILGVVEDAPNWVHGRSPETQRHGHRLLTSSSQLMRGAVANKLAGGVDAIEWFNFFCTDQKQHRGYRGRFTAVDAQGLGDAGLARYETLDSITDPAHLRGQTKHYALASETGAWMFDAFEYAEQVPCLIEPGWRKPFRLTMLDEPNDAKLELVVQLVVQGDADPTLGVSFNGCWPSFAAEPTDELLFPAGEYTHHMPEHRAFNYRFDVSRVRSGWNEVLVFNDSDQPAPAGTVKIVSVELAIRHAERTA